MSPTQARERVIKLATTDTAGALEAARRVDDPWFACQALAWVARFAPDRQVESIAAEALAAGRREQDGYKAVGSAAWPIRAMIERGCTRRLGPVLAELLRLAPQIAHPASRSEALFLLFQGTFSAGKAYWEPVFRALVQVSDPSRHWRQGRNLRDAVLIVASADAGFAAAFAPTVRDDRTRRQIEQRLAQADSAETRSFF